MHTHLIFTIGMMLAGGTALFLVYKAYKQTRAEGLRPFGFMCDQCTGKRDKNGNLYIRCLIKPVILHLFGVDINQTEKERYEPDEFRW